MKYIVADPEIFLSYEEQNKITDSLDRYADDDDYDVKLLNKFVKVLTKKVGQKVEIFLMGRGRWDLNFLRGEGVLKSDFRKGYSDAVCVLKYNSKVEALLQKNCPENPEYPVAIFEADNPEITVKPKGVSLSVLKISTSSGIIETAKSLKELKALEAEWFKNGTPLVF